MPMSTDGPIIELRDFGIRYGDRFILQHVNVSLYTGVTSLVGANGAGKTSLLKAIAGLIKPTEGRVKIEALRADGRAVVGYLPQSPSATSLLTAQAYVEYFAYLAGVARRLIPGAAMNSLRLVDMQDHASATTTKLSGGMFRRVALAAAIVHSPDIVLLDEPTVGLDPVQRERFHELLTIVLKRRTVVISTHLLDEVQRLADNVVMLDRQNVAFVGTVQELGASDRTYRETGILTNAAFLRYFTGPTQ